MAHLTHTSSAPPPGTDSSASHPGLQDKGNSISVKSWKIKATKLPILDSAHSDQATLDLNMPLPEICFGKNSLRLEDSDSGLVLQWDTMSALRGVEVGNDGGVKVAHANEWARGQASGSSSDLKVLKPFDWTYTTTHPGSVASFASATAPAPTFQPAPSGHPGIPLRLLARQDIPVTFFEEVPLFEDELGDNGIAEVNVRVRVNEFSFFVLSRFFLRVDGVLFRVFDTRTYHEFGTTEVIRERKGRQASYADLRARLPSDRPDDLSPLTDVNWVAAQLEALASVPPPKARRVPAQWPAPKHEPSGLPPAMAGLSLRGPRTLRSPLEPVTATPPPSGEANVPLPTWEALGRKLEVLRLPVTPVR